MDESARIRRTYWMRYPALPSYANRRFSGRALVRRSIVPELTQQTQPIAEVVNLCSVSRCSCQSCVQVRDSHGRAGYFEFV
jgi:hypothetical protein